MLALIAALGIDQGTALAVAEGAQAPLAGSVELDVFGPELLVHPLDAGPGDLWHRALRRTVVAEAKQRLFRLQRDHQEGPADIGEGETIEGRVRPDADVEEPVGLPGGAG